MKTYNTHSHFRVNLVNKHIGLKSIFGNSYVGWQNQLRSESREDIRDYFEKNMTMRAFIQLKTAIEKLYGNGLSLDEDTWDIFNEKIIESYNDYKYENYVLREICQYDEIILDDYINIRNDGSNGVKCKVALRCDFMFYGYSKESLLSCEANPFEFYDCVPDNIDDYVNKMKCYIKESLEMGKCTALKICMAYFRDISFDIIEKEKANLVYKDNNNPEYIKYFQDYVMCQLCEISEEYNIPVQIHTGLGQIHGTSAINLIPLINRYSSVKFALLHGSFPWIEDLLAVLYNCPNAYLDICWMPLLTCDYAKKALINTLELIGTDRIMWGCDTSTVEESYGALLAVISLLNEVNLYFIRKGAFNKQFGQKLREKVLYDNAKAFFKSSDYKYN